MVNTIIENQALPVNAQEKRNTIIRVIHNRENPFVQLNKQALWDEKLSLKAVGLWSRCMSRPNDWQFCITELVKRCKEGRRAIDAAMKELIQAGYAYRLEFSERGADGKYKNSGVEYVFFEFPATEAEKKEQEEIFKKSFQLCGFGNSRYGNFRNDHLLIKSLTETDSTETDLTPLTSPQKADVSQRESEENAAKAAGEGVEDLPKPKREKQEFSSHVKEVTTQMIDLARKHEITYRPPKDLTQFFKSVQEMVEEEKQDLPTLMKSFEWAVKDNEKRGDFNGWRGIVCTNVVKGKPTNPAKQFHKNLTKINSARQSQPKRKFAASSNDEEALETLREMNARAI